MSEVEMKWLGEKSQQHVAYFDIEMANTVKGNLSDGGMS